MSNSQPYVDTHCHIDSVLTRENITWPELLARMGDPLPAAMVHVACHPEQLAWAEEFARTAAEKQSSRNPVIRCAYGIHPHEASLYNDSVEQELLRLQGTPHAVAFGEIGLDYHYDYSPRSVQCHVFERQLQLAKQLGKPVVLHTREADDDTLEILQRHDSPNLLVHVHCYTGSAEFAQKLLGLSGSYYFGFTGVVTFKNADNVRAAVRVIPADRLLLETDAPYLAPIPWRGKTAHSGMIPTIAQALAEVRDESLTQLLAACRANTRRFYGI